MHIGIIGFGDKMEWPQHYTVNGKTNIEGEVKNMKFDKGLPEVTYKVIFCFIFLLKNKKKLYLICLFVH